MKVFGCQFPFMARNQRSCPTNARNCVSIQNVKLILIMIEEITLGNPKNSNVALADIVTRIIPYEDQNFCVVFSIPTTLNQYHTALILSPLQLDQFREWLGKAPTTSKTIWVNAFRNSIRFGIITAVLLGVFALVMFLLPNNYYTLVHRVTEFSVLFLLFGIGPYGVYIAHRIFADRVHKLSQFLVDELGAVEPRHKAPRNYITTEFAIRGSQRRALFAFYFFSVLTLGLVYSIQLTAQEFLNAYKTKDLISLMWLIATGGAIAFLPQFVLSSIAMAKLWLFHKRFQLQFGRPVSRADLYSINAETGEMSTPANHNEVKNITNTGSSNPV